jgi:hypothetical protein
MSNNERGKSVALIKFKVATAGAGAPKVIDDNVLDLHPGDRLLFEAEVPAGGGPAPEVYVSLSDSLVALVKFKGPPIFTATAQADGSIVVELEHPGGGGGPDQDPP